LLAERRQALGVKVNGGSFDVGITDPLFIGIGSAVCKTSTFRISQFVE
jgi:hypothetical protein